MKDPQLIPEQMLKEYYPKSVTDEYATKTAPEPIIDDYKAESNLLPWECLRRPVERLLKKELTPLPHIGPNRPQIPLSF